MEIHRSLESDSRTLSESWSQYRMDHSSRAYCFAPAVHELIHRVQFIEATLLRIREKNVELSALIAPVQSLPVEVLVMIFRIGCKLSSEPSVDIKGNPTLVYPFPMLIASVSRRWRWIALNSPALWTDLRITTGEPRAWPALAIERSALRLLSITLYCRSPRASSQATVTSNLDAIMPHIDRWQRFTLITHHSEVVDIVGRRLARARSPHLQHLRISLTGSGPTGNQEIFLPRILTGGAPVLSSVRLDSVSLAWWSPLLAGLSTLDLRWMWGLFKPDYATFRHLLEISPSLERLILRGSYIDLHPNTIYAPIQAPSLRYLELSGDNVCRMSSILKTPSLETLTLANVDESEFREFVSSFQGSTDRYARLRSLSLLNVATCPLPYSFTQAFSSITHLMIVNSGADRFLQLLRTKQSSDYLPQDSFIWPRLDTLTIVDDANYDMLYSMVVERATQPQALPLRRLVVHTAYAHSHHFVPTLKKYVKIDSFKGEDYDFR